jgi:hypothetical protein
MGFRQGLVKKQKSDWTLAFVRCCPSLRIVTVSSQATKLAKALLKDFTFVSMTTNGDQIGTVKLIVRNLVANNITHSFTHRITKVGCLNHDVLTDMFERGFSVLDMTAQFLLAR